MHEIACVSCGLTGRGKYCSGCGSLLRTRLPTAAEFATEAVTDVIGIHRRALSTLRSALLDPGGVTDAYRRGDGSMFASPIKVYLTISAAFFVSAPLVGAELFVGPGLDDVRPDLIMFVSLPVLALWLKVFYGWIGGYKALYSECFMVATSFQTILFAIWTILLWVGTISGALAGALLAASGIYAAGYFWFAAKRLWSERGLLGPVRSAGIVVVYLVSTVLVGLALGALLA